MQIGDSWNGSAWAVAEEQIIPGESAYDRVIAAAEQINIFIDKEMLNSLVGFPGSAVRWVTEERRDAKQYGSPVQVEINGEVIAEDQEGGFLVLLDETPVASNPEEYSGTDDKGRPIRSRADVDRMIDDMYDPITERELDIGKDDSVFVQEIAALLGCKSYGGGKYGCKKRQVALTLLKAAECRSTAAQQEFRYELKFDPKFDTDFVQRHAAGIDCNRKEMGRYSCPSRGAAAGLYQFQRLEDITQKLKERGLANNPFEREMDYNPYRENFQAQEIAQRYVADRGLPPIQAIPYVPVNPAVSQQIAQAFIDMQDSPNDPEVRAAYEALIEETEEQFARLPVEIIAADSSTYPYKNSQEMMDDVLTNGRLFVFDGGDDHSIFSRDQNFKFRAVHDYFGHAQHGFAFGPRGEENAWLEHSKMFTPLARKALTTETRGQNSYVNFGPHSHLPVTERPYAEQKVGILPDQFITHPAFEMAYSGYPDHLITSVGYNPPLVAFIRTVEAFHGMSQPLTGKLKAPAWFTTSKEHAAGYGPYVYAAKLLVRNPYKAKFVEEIWTDSYNQKWVRDKKKKGFDGVLYEGFPSEGNWFVVFDDTQIIETRELTDNPNMTPFFTGFEPEAKRGVRKPGVIKFGKKVITKVWEYFDAGQAGLNWYEETPLRVMELFNGDRARTNLFIGFLAATSPLRNIWRNTQLALRALKQYDNCRSSHYSQCFDLDMPNHVTNAIRVAEGTPLSGPKVSAFFRNLTEPYDKDSGEVTVDTWMLRAFGLRGSSTKEEQKSGAPSPAEYLAVQKKVQELAQEAGVLPRQFQAAVWVGIKILEGDPSDTADPFELALFKQLEAEAQQQVFEFAEDDALQEVRIRRDALAEERDRRAREWEMYGPLTEKFGREIGATQERLSAASENPGELDEEDFNEVGEVIWDKPLPVGYKGILFSNGRVAAWRTVPGRDGSEPHHMDVEGRLRRDGLIPDKPDYDTLNLTHMKRGAHISGGETLDEAKDRITLAIRYFKNLRLDDMLYIGTCESDTDFGGTVRQWHAGERPDWGDNPSSNPLRFQDSFKESLKNEKANVLVEMPADIFLKLTTLGKEHADRIMQEAKDLDEYNKYGEIGQINYGPFLKLNSTTGEILSHEGRHRAAAVLRAGETHLPVSIFLTGKDGYKSRTLSAKDLPAVWYGEFDEGFSWKADLRILEPDIQRSWNPGEYDIAMNPVDDFLRSIGASDDVVEYVKDSDPEVQGKLANAVRKQPLMTLEALKSFEGELPQKKKRENTEEELKVVRQIFHQRDLTEYPEEFKKWLLIQLIKSRGFKVDGKQTYKLHRDTEGGTMLTGYDDGVSEFFRDNVMRIADWVNVVHPDLHHFTWVEANEATEAWHAECTLGDPNEKYLPLDPADVDYEFDDGSGFYVTQLTKEHDFRIEGSKMGHCVGKDDYYFRKYEDGRCVVYSLRDAKNEPHATVELSGKDNKEVIQIQGKENKEPLKKYKVMLREWFERHDFYKSYGDDKSVISEMWEHQGEDAHFAIHDYMNALDGNVEPFDHDYDYGYGLVENWDTREDATDCLRELRHIYKAQNDVGSDKRASERERKALEAFDPVEFAAALIALAELQDKTNKKPYKYIHQLIFEAADLATEVVGGSWVFGNKLREMIWASYSNQPETFKKLSQAQTEQKVYDAFENETGWKPEELDTDRDEYLQAFDAFVPLYLEDNPYYAVSFEILKQVGIEIPLAEFSTDRDSPGQTRFQDDDGVAWNPHNVAMNPVDDFLRKLGAAEDVIQHVFDADEETQGKLANAVRKQPSITLADLIAIEEKLPQKRKNTKQEEMFVASFYGMSPEMSKWFSIQLIKARGKDPEFPNEFVYYMLPNNNEVDGHAYWTQLTTPVRYSPLYAPWHQIKDWADQNHIDLHLYNYKQALDLSTEWHEEFRTACSAGSGEEYTPLNPALISQQLSDGYFMVLVNSEHDLKTEGAKMGHCVGGYWSAVQEGSIEIYSLRDKKNRPHATVEIGAWPDERGDVYFTRVKQIQGKENNEPAPKYKALLKEWFQGNKSDAFGEYDKYIEHGLESDFSRNQSRPELFHGMLKAAADKADVKDEDTRGFDPDYGYKITVMYIISPTPAQLYKLISQLYSNRPAKTYRGLDEFEVAKQLVRMCELRSKVRYDFSGQDLMEDVLEDLSSVFGKFPVLDFLETRGHRYLPLAKIQSRLRGGAPVGFVHSEMMQQLGRNVVPSYARKVQNADDMVIIAKRAGLTDADPLTEDIVQTPAYAEYAYNVSLQIMPYSLAMRILEVVGDPYPDPHET